MSAQKLKLQESMYQISLRKLSKEEKTNNKPQEKARPTETSTNEEYKIVIHQEAKIEETEGYVEEHKEEPQQQQHEKEEELLTEQKEEEIEFYLPRLNPEFEKDTYSLVLDLDETLVHFAEVTNYS